MEAAIDLANAMEARGEGRILDQFSNPDNPPAHYETTGPEIWRDTQGAVTHFVSAMGTTGTIMGTGRYLKEQNPAIQIVGVQPDGGRQASPASAAGPRPICRGSTTRPGRSDHRCLPGGGGGRPTRALAAREGIFGGVSSGGAVAAALSLSREVSGAVIVAIVCDRGDRYLSTGVFPA